MIPILSAMAATRRHASLLPVTRVQATGSGTQTAASGTQATSPFGSSVTIGHAIVVFPCSRDTTNTNTVTGVSDGTANVYTQVPGVLHRQTMQLLDCWICASATVGGTLTVTATYLHTTGANAVTAIELSGPIALDQVAVASAASGTAPNSGATPATTHASDQCFGITCTGGKIISAPMFSTALSSSVTEAVASNTLSGSQFDLNITDGILVASGVAQTFSDTIVTAAWICACVIFA